VRCCLLPRLGTRPAGHQQQSMYPHMHPVSELHRSASACYCRRCCRG
jgi:hypothetical protein